jgi:hypothetical protein
MLTRATNGRQDSSLQRPISHRHHAVLWSHHLDANPDPDFYLMRIRIFIWCACGSRCRLPKWCGSGSTTLVSRTCQGLRNSTNIWTDENAINMDTRQSESWFMQKKLKSKFLWLCPLKARIPLGGKKQTWALPPPFSSSWPPPWAAPSPWSPPSPAARCTSALRCPRPGRPSATVTQQSSKKWRQNR